MQTITESPRQVPVIADVDVCVIGGGPGGLPAAIAAARQGASVMLVEMQGFLGGMATAGFIGPIIGHVGSRSTNPIIGGIPREICERMAAIGEAWDWERSREYWGVPFNAEGFKIIADRLVQEAGVRVMYHTFFADSVVADGRMTHALVESKSGRQAIAARVFVDATGDADVAVRAGAECTHGRPADGKVMAMGSMFRIGGVSTLTEEVKQAIQAKMRAAVAAGELNLYNSSLGHPGATIHEDELTANITRFGGDPSDVADLTQGELFTRELTWQVVDLWRSVPGAEGLRLIATPTHVGLRESRQVVGVERISGPDVVAARKADTGIARCGNWIDIHCPRGLVGKGEVHLCTVRCKNRDCYMLTEYADQLPDELYPPDGDWFDIPYGSLVPRELDGLVVSGRCISADYQAMAAARVMGPCLAIGEAAGTAAGMAAGANVSPRNVDVAALRSTLTKAGALV